jgi:hypothetical protein
MLRVTSAIYAQALLAFTLGLAACGPGSLAQEPAVTPEHVAYFPPSQVRLTAAGALHRDSLVWERLLHRMREPALWPERADVDTVYRLTVLPNGFPHAYRFEHGAAGWRYRVVGLRGGGSEASIGGISGQARGPLPPTLMPVLDSLRAVTRAGRDSAPSLSSIELDAPAFLLEAREGARYWAVDRVGIGAADRTDLKIAGRLSNLDWIAFQQLSRAP